MQRWHLTLGLALLALGGALLAPRLDGLRALVAAPPAPPPEPVVVGEPAPTPPEQPDTLLRLDIGLDQPALLRGVADTRYVVVDVDARGDGVPTRVPVDVAVVLDSSCSMLQQGKLDYARAAAKQIVSALTPADTFSLVTFDADAKTLLPATPVVDVDGVSAAIDSIRARGGTNVYGGLVAGGDNLARTDAGRVKRVVLLSDGEANIGFDKVRQFAPYLDGLRSRGIATSTIGLGHEYNEDLLASLADLGGGSYRYVASATALSDVFSTEIEQVASVVARDVTLDLTLADGVELLQVIGWDARIAGNSASIDLGDVWAGQHRKVVVEVKARKDEVVRMGVATATLTYDVVADGSKEQAFAAAFADVTTDARQVASTIDKERTAEAVRAASALDLDRSSRAYLAGDREGARAIAERGRALVAEKAAELDDADLASESRAFEEAARAYEAYAPHTVEGRSASKKVKALFRDSAR